MDPLTTENTTPAPAGDLINQISAQATSTKLGVNSAFTADDLAKAREQEKAKLYPQMEKMKEELAVLKQREEEAIAREALREQERLSKEQEKAEALKRQEEEELSAKELLAKKEQEWNARFEQESLEREKAFSLLQKEREFAELMNYRQQRLEQERDTIVPQLIDLISGNTQDEIEHSIALLKEKSAGIMQDVQASMQATKQQMRGASVTAPSSGPLDNDSAQHSYSPEGIKDMPLSEYAKIRNKVLPSANNRGQGLFG